MEKTEIENLDWSNKHLKSIQKDTFKNYNNLTKLNISSNVIYLINNHAFDGLTSLKHLDLSNNKLKTV
jgi:hypothetical protein